MPKLTRTPSHHRYSNLPALSLPVNLPTGSSDMPYYSPRPISAYYTDMSTSGAPTTMGMSPYEQYAVAPLTTMPTNTATLGGPVGPPPPLPTQHRASSGAWTPQDDQLLLQARAAGQNWNQIQGSYFPGKSGNACRKRHERLMERKGANGWDTRKMERISKEYMSLRKEIWSPLAQRCGEKWMVIEAKCMSNGLKNIQTHARAYARKERLASGQAPMASYEDEDEGLSQAELDELADLPYSSPAATSSSGGGGAPHSAGGSSSSGGSGVPYHGATMHGQGGGGGSGGGGYPSYGYGTAPQRQYTSSVSSGSTAGYAQQAGPISQDGSPYMDAGNRLQSTADMGIDAIINRGPGGTSGI